MKKKFGKGILVFVLCFGYLFLQNKIPDEVSVRPGETLQLHTGIPLSMEQKEEEPVTLASMVFGPVSYTHLSVAVNDAGRNIRSTKDVQPGEDIVIRVTDGAVLAKVTGIKEQIRWEKN